ncbi:MAG: class I SAM-dependent methyltransferase [Hyphomonadaceae bacterium]|nr:class I SAM-dependent methyltransferase [Hyphomonadaceae bacterium]
MTRADLARKTIDDFSEQWSRYPDNSGHYGSVDYFADVLDGLLTIDDVRDAKVGDIGSGSGRIVDMLLDAGAARVWAVEPADGAFAALKANTAARADRIDYLHMRGEDVPSGLDLDLVVSLGVIHHIPDPMPTMRAVHGALRRGGRCFIWLYGREGNEAYLAIAEPLRRVTTRLPAPVLAALSSVLNVALAVYIQLCAVMPLPLHTYARKVLKPLAWDKRRLIIYDQLNPAYAKYYTESEAKAVMADAGFTDVRVRRRHGYSWQVLGTKA